MRRRLGLLLLAALLLPTVLALGLGWRAIREHGSRLDAQERALAGEELRRAGAAVEAMLAELTDRLGSRLATATLDSEGLRRLEQKVPEATQVFRIDARTGRVLHPSAGGHLTPREEAFLGRTHLLWDARPLPPRGEGDPPEEAWSAFYWQEGLRLVRWQRDHEGHWVGVELSRSRLLGEVLARLPAGSDAGVGSDLGFRFVDARGGTVYQWGRLPGEGDPEPAVLARRRFADPLGAWGLEAYRFAPPDGGAGIFLGAAGAALLIVGTLLGILFYRESSREMREAEQRVTFVNQVSHELKTPLTNIRLYADLLRERLPEERPDLSRFADVVVGESERLTRLVQNVLTFGRTRRDGYRVHPQVRVPDELVCEVATRFEPALASRGLEVDLDLQAPDEMNIDPDVLQLVLGNLLSNAEKYAPDTGSVVIDSRRVEGRLEIGVEDRGPGVPEPYRQAVFEPFVRGDDRLTEGVSGAGIGLALSRQLARSHGGDLVLAPTRTGARFVLTLEDLPLS